MAYDSRKDKQLSTKNPYYLPDAAFRNAFYFALRYHEFVDKLETLGDGARGISYDSQPHGDSKGTALEDLAIKRAKISARIDLIVSSCVEADRELAPWLFKAVTNRNIGYEYLDQIGVDGKQIPCGSSKYYNRRRKFYYILAQKLDEQ